MSLSPREPGISGAGGGRRFAFGENWRRFLSKLHDDGIAAAEASLRTALGVERLDGLTFLDVGSGSGLFSLAAHRLGASVVSFDHDPESVACTLELRRRFSRGGPAWTVVQASALDGTFLDSLPLFDVVYAWGVLHHTGALWRAMDIVQRRVRAEGRLVLSVYNDQGRASQVWRAVKRSYNRLPRPLRLLVLGPSFLYIWGPTAVLDLLRGRPFGTWRGYQSENRGMSPWRDVVDWVGGYPFEVARPEAVFDFMRRRGFELRRLATRGGGHGCNEFVFRRTAPRDSGSAPAEGA